MSRLSKKNQRSVKDFFTKVTDEIGKDGPKPSRGKKIPIAAIQPQNLNKEVPAVFDILDDDLADFDFDFDMLATNPSKIPKKFKESAKETREYDLIDDDEVSVLRTKGKRSSNRRISSSDEDENFIIEDFSPVKKTIVSSNVSFPPSKPHSIVTHSHKNSSTANKSASFTEEINDFGAKFTSKSEANNFASNLASKSPVMSNFGAKFASKSPVAEDSKHSDFPSNNFPMNSCGFGDSMHVDQILKHPVLRVWEIEKEDIPILETLKKSLTEMICDIFLKFSEQDIKNIPNYDSQRHFKIVSAFKKVSEMLGNAPSLQSNVTKNSSNITETSSNVDQTSSNIAETSSNIAETSRNVGKVDNITHYSPFKNDDFQFAPLADNHSSNASNYPASNHSSNASNYIASNHSSNASNYPASNHSSNASNYPASNHSSIASNYPASNHSSNASNYPAPTVKLPDSVASKFPINSVSSLDCSPYHLQKFPHRNKPNHGNDIDQPNSNTYSDFGDDFNNHFDGSSFSSPKIKNPKYVFKNLSKNPQVSNENSELSNTSFEFQSSKEWTATSKSLNTSTECQSSKEWTATPKPLITSTEFQSSKGWTEISKLSHSGTDLQSNSMSSKIDDFKTSHAKNKPIVNPPSLKQLREFPVNSPSFSSASNNQKGNTMNSSDFSTASCSSFPTQGNISNFDFDDDWDDLPYDTCSDLSSMESYSLKTDLQLSSKSCPQEPPRGVFKGSVRNDGVTGEFSGMGYPHSGEVSEIFQSRFGLQKFRENQLEVINAVLLKNDCFVLMPTGGGKSLCYQLPACLLDGVTFVISPLRSLIQDQVQKMCSLDVPVGHLSGEFSVKDESVIYTNLMKREPELKLVYVTPEKLSASQKLLGILRNLFQRNKLSLFVIDEAHCVSQWGHDFRPDYKKLNLLRSQFNSVPVMALTATATPRVRMDILHQLDLKNPKWFLSSFNRSNLRYEVVDKKGKKKAILDIAEFIKKRFRGLSGIVYCLSRNECDTVSKDLATAGLSAVSYHAGLTDGQRSDVQHRWSNDQIKIVCATIAFGMGIDKPDVRFVFHYSLPKSVEGYYQESGRAGRDGEIATCILFYSYQDVLRIKKMINMDRENWNAKQTHLDNIFRMVAYCENKTDCRRVQLLNYFGEIFSRESCIQSKRTICDNCRDQDKFIRIDMTKEAKLITRAVKDLCKGTNWQNRYTLNHIVDIFKGSENKKVVDAGHHKHLLHGVGKDWSRNDAERLVRRLVLEGYLLEEMIEMGDIVNAYIRCGQKADLLLSSSSLKIEFEVLKKCSENKQEVVTTTENTEHDEVKWLTDQCHEELVEAVKRLAAERGLRHTNAINPAALRQMSKSMPDSETEMKKIPHITQAVYEKFGRSLLEITQRYKAQIIVIQNEQDASDFKSEGENGDWLNSISAPNVTSTSTNGSTRRGVSRKFSANGRGGLKFKKRKKGFSTAARKRFAAAAPRDEPYRVKATKRGAKGAGKSGFSASPKVSLLAPPQPRSFLGAPKFVQL